MTVQALKFFHKLKQYAPAHDKKHFDVVEQALEEVEQYRALGTVEELKEAREKQIPMKIKEIHVDEYYCPACGSELNCNDAKVEDKYCSECGQRFEVSEDD